MIVDRAFVDNYLRWANTDIKNYIGWTYVKFPIELVYIVDTSGLHLITWMNNTLRGDDWVYMDKTFFFKNEKDATMFSLKWL